MRRDMENEEKGREVREDGRKTKIGDAGERRNDAGKAA